MSIINHDKEATKGAPAKGDAKASAGKAKGPSARAEKAYIAATAKLKASFANIGEAREHCAIAIGKADQSYRTYTAFITDALGLGWHRVPEKGRVDDNLKAVQTRRLEEHDAFKATMYAKGRSVATTSKAWKRICEEYAPELAGEVKGANEKRHWRAKTLEGLGRDYMRINEATDSKDADLDAAALIFKAYEKLGGDVAALNKKLQSA